MSQGFLTRIEGFAALLIVALHLTYHVLCVSLYLLFGYKIMCCSAVFERVKNHDCLQNNNMAAY